MFENISRELKLVLGSGPGAGTTKSSEAIKVETSDLPSEEVLFANGYVRKDGGGHNRGRGGGRGYGGGRGGYNSRGGGRGGHYDGSSGGGKAEKPKSYEGDKPYRRPNRPGEDGKPSQCHHCHSIYHYLSKCPDRSEENVHLTEEVTVLFTEDRNELSQFTQEARNCAALDTCCSSSVSGKDWLEMYLDAI